MIEAITLAVVAFMCTILGGIVATIARPQPKGPDSLDVLLELIKEQQRTLMFFHKAGERMADYELRYAQFETQIKESQAEAAKWEAKKAEAEAPPKRTGTPPPTNVIPPKPMHGEGGRHRTVLASE